jgi:restriction system protein
MQFMPFMIVTLGVIYLWQSARYVFVVVGLLLAVIAIFVYISSSENRRKREELLELEEVEKKQIAADLEAEQIQIAADKIVFRQQVLERIAHHSKTLARKANQSIYQDDYKQYVFGKWFTECDYFIANVLTNECPGLQLHVDAAWLRETITDAALKAKDDEMTSSVLPEGMSPIEFENYCALLLRNSGWDARVTQASGDQGVDIVAELDGIKAVFQCKLYASPVGNAAVQEVIAGKQFESAQIACVISNNTFTTAARQLAAVANVHLLHFSELTEFGHRLAVTPQ